HRRHYEATLTETLLHRFPATVWLIGLAPADEAARAFVRARPPAAPCLAEYGKDFPAYLMERAGDTVPYVGPFGALEWLVGEVTLAVDRAALRIDALSAIDPDALPDVVLRLQDGLRFLEAAWPVDDLMMLYLAEHQPDRHVLVPEAVRLQVRGARGS